MKAILNWSWSFLGWVGCTQLKADNLESGEASLLTQNTSETLMYWSVDTLVLVFLAFIVLIFAWSIYSNWSNSNKLSSVGFSRLVKGPTAENLFLGLRFRLAGQPNLDLVGYVRSMDTKLLKIVVDGSFHKGQYLDLILSSLPNFPLEKSIVRSRVVSVNKIGGDPLSRLLTLKFEDDESDQITQIIADYIFQLSKPRVVLQHA